MVEPLAPFDDDLIATVAEEYGLAAATLREVLADHQELFRGFGERSVADMVYEWRTGLPGDPLVARTDAVVYLDAPEHAWEDLLGRLAVDDGGMPVDDDAAGALRAVHVRQFEADRGTAPEGAVVVARD